MNRLFVRSSSILIAYTTVIFLAPVGVVMLTIAIRGIKVFRISLVLGLLTFASPLVQSAQTDAETIKIETSLVWVPVSVKAKNGGGIAGLTKDRFRIFEDGLEQGITDFESQGAAITVALVIDMSDSARISLADMRKAASAFIDKLESRDKALIVAFDKNIHRVIGATDDRDMLKLGLAGISTGGGTALYDAVEHLMARSFDGISGRKAVILLTDAIDTSSVKATFQSSADQAAAGNIAFFPIQFQPEAISRLRVAPENNQGGTVTLITTPSGESIAAAHQRGTRYLRLLADSSGGRFQLADSTKNLEAAFTQIAAELRQLYYIGYYSNKEATKPEKRKLVVKVDVPNADVDSRDSYIAKP